MKKTDNKRMIAACFIGWIDPVKVVIPNVKSVVVLRRIYPVFRPKKGCPISYNNDFLLLLHSGHHFRRVFLSNAHHMKNTSIESTGVSIDYDGWGIHKCFLFPYLHAKQ